MIKRVLLFVLLASLAPSLRAICFRNPGQGNDFNTNAPSGAYASAAWLWDVMAVAQGGMFYVPIGPQLVAVPGHVGASVGQQLSIQGQTVTITNVIKSTNQVDALYAQTDKAVATWYPLYNGEAFTAANKLLSIGTGVGRSSNVTNAGGEVLGYVLDTGPTFKKRWAVSDWFVFTPDLEQISQVLDTGCQCFVTVSNHITRVEGYGSATNTMSYWASAGDSGGPFFLNCGTGTNAWRLAGFMTTGYEAGSQVLFHQELSSGGWGFYVDRGLIERLNEEAGCRSVYRP